jgi:glycosyltransferase involved in cell wall biosynthesis
MDELESLFSPIGRVVRSNYTNTYDLRGRSLAHLFSARVACRLATKWRALAPDIIHLNKQNLEDGLDLLDAADRSGLPSIATIHITQTAVYLRARFARLRDWTARRFLRRYKGWLVPTLAERQRELEQFVGDAARIRLVVNGVPLYDLTERAARRAWKRAELGIPNDALLIVAAARMVPQKRPLHWLDWAEKIRAAVPNVRFLWIGDGSLITKFDAAVAARGLTGTVKRVAWTNDVPPFLQAADVFMHTAEFEGLAFSVLEALSAGLALAVTPNLLAEMPFLNASNSIPLDDGTRWAEILRDRDRLVERGRAARRLAEEQFSFDRMARDYEALYCEISGHKS